MPAMNDPHKIDRRTFIQTGAAAGAALAAGSSAQAKVTPVPGEVDRRHEVATMPYRQLGRTNFMSSRLVFGCGAALAGGKAVRLLEQAYEAGINFYDVGSNIYYKGSEKHLAPFFSKYRDKIWVTSKAPVRTPRGHEPGTPLSVEEGKTVADFWTNLLEASLRDLETDYVDAYYLMAVDDPDLVKSEEVYNAFVRAKEAGKVGHFGVSTHKRAGEVLEAMIETGWYDLAMVAITPAGWYDWDSRNILEGTPPMTELQATLEKARAAGIGIVGMKAARFLSGAASGGKNDPNAFDEFYDEKIMGAELNPFQRTYAYVLAHGVDVVNADMQNLAHFEENLVAVQKAESIFA